MALERHALAAVASLIGEPTRAALLLALLDGRSVPAGVLARIVQLSAAATSLHLAKMTAGGLLEVTQQGRHRYYRIAGPNVAHALEALGAIATHAAPPRSLSPARDALRAARTCYDHLAGTVAVELARNMEHAGVLRVASEQRYEATAGGITWFAERLDIDVAALQHGRRAFARRCLDWTERRPHLAGALGAAILERLLERRWITRSRDSRAVLVTRVGQPAIAQLFATLSPTHEAPRV